jgi:tetratricopeptide (TPR) repeat protein
MKPPRLAVAIVLLLLVSPAFAQTKFAALSAQAEAAGKAGELDQAVDLYQQALAIKPTWTEGRWSLGMALYDLDRFEPARDAFRRVLSTRGQDKNGTAWAMKGLCEYRLKNYDTALADLLRARQFGVSSNAAVVDVARYHTAILSIRNEQYDQALGILSEFAIDGNESPRIIEAMGIATLRLPMLPQELPGEKREIVMMAGRARYFMAARMGPAAQNAYETLINRFPDTPNVHYAFGIFLMAEQPDAAIAEFKRELNITPQHVLAKVQIASALIRRGDFEGAKPWAQQAVDAAPTDFIARNALGQTLLETGDVPGAIRELEQGVKMAPEVPVMHFALARAYRRAGRGPDADREQAEFTRLDRLARASRTGAASVGGIDSDGSVSGSSTKKPQPR